MRRLSMSIREHIFELAQLPKQLAMEQRKRWVLVPLHFAFANSSRQSEAEFVDQNAMMFRRSCNAPNAYFSIGIV